MCTLGIDLRRSGSRARHSMSYDRDKGVVMHRPQSVHNYGNERSTRGSGTQWIEVHACALGPYSIGLPRQLSTDTDRTRAAAPGGPHTYLRSSHSATHHEPPRSPREHGNLTRSIEPEWATFLGFSEPEWYRYVGIVTERARARSISSEGQRGPLQGGVEGGPRKAIY